MAEPYAGTTACHQRVCVGHDSTYSNVRADPSRVEVWTVGRTLRSLCCHVLEVVCGNPGSVGGSVVILEDGIWSQIEEIWGCHWLQKLVILQHWDGLQPSCCPHTLILPPSGQYQHSIVCMVRRISGCCQSGANHPQQINNCFQWEGNVAPLSQMCWSSSQMGHY